MLHVSLIQKQTSILLVCISSYCAPERSWHFIVNLLPSFKNQSIFVWYSACLILTHKAGHFHHASPWGKKQDLSFLRHGNKRTRYLVKMTHTRALILDSGHDARLCVIMAGSFLWVKGWCKPLTSHSRASNKSPLLLKYFVTILFAQPMLHPPTLKYSDLLYV